MDQTLTAGVGPALRDDGDNTTHKPVVRLSTDAGLYDTGKR
jgi:hypothetical protein